MGFVNLKKWNKSKFINHANKVRIFVRDPKLKTSLIFSIASVICCLQVATAATFSLATVKDTTAVCNNGRIANYWIADQNSNKWLIQLPGGGAAWDANTYKKRKFSRKAPAEGSWLSVSESAIAAQFYDIGYNVIKLHYCTSDLYAGDHINQISGKSVPFRGRRIVTSILDEHEAAFREASDVVVAGTSAGVYGIVLNLDLISQIPKVRLVLDSIWRDAFQRSIKTPSNGWTKFPLGEMPSHCDGDFNKNCQPSEAILEKYGINSAFLIFNFGDPYHWAKKDNQKRQFVAAFEKEAARFGGGFSVDAKQFNLVGAQKWGHGLLRNKRFYHKNVGSKSLADTVLEWVKTGKSIHIKY